ncbi:hypothetical protein [Streptomyces sp. NPDC020965]|uniref:hypothetical protein n=1 Tax=Streptomyces sp. NPDC020965 TaxID=3365105 RepID=UPI0037A0B7F2
MSGEHEPPEPGGPSVPPSDTVPTGAAPPADADPPHEEHEEPGEHEDEDPYDELGHPDPYGFVRGLRDVVSGAGGGYSPIIYAPGSNVAAAVTGGQRVANEGRPTGPGDRLVEAHEGPISTAEIQDARRGFAEPSWFAAALTTLDSRVLFLTGEPGTGRRTAALNLLHRHSGDSTALRAVDSEMDFASWRPTHPDARGYLVDGLLPTHPWKAAMLGNLRRRLIDANARMVIVLPDDPGLVRDLQRDLHVTPLHCQPPPPRAVFAARLEAAVPDRVERGRLLDALEPGLLDELLVPELVPAQVAELVAALTSPRDADDTGPGDIRDRLSFLAEEEVPDLIRELSDDADGLAFLLSTCVFEGLDHRIVREEADRLLTVADGRLHSVLPATDASDDGGGHGERGRRAESRPNPRFVFRKSLEELLRTVRARRAPSEVLRGYGFSYAVEPVRFTRHRQAETVLRHVWREYGQLSAVLTSWLDDVKDRRDMTQPVGRVMGMAAAWGGGRTALRHIRELAKSERECSRAMAAHAFGVAAADPTLATEVKYRLTQWSTTQSWQLRSTVAYTCGTEFGISRPDLAMRLLRRLPGGPRNERDDHETRVDLAVRTALWALFAAGNQHLVLGQLAAWTDQEGSAAELALRAFPPLLHEAAWFQAELLDEGDFAQTIIELIRRALNTDETFERTSHRLVDWCRTAVWSDGQQAAVELLLTVLAREMRLGELRLFVEIDRHEDAELAGRGIVRDALEEWRADLDPPRTPRGGPYAQGSTS